MTKEQKQCLLRYLGYPVGPIDGIWGRASQEATREFQQDQGLVPDGIFGPETQKRILEAICRAETDGRWEGILHFTREEFACKCGCWCDGFPAEPERALLVLAQQVRQHFGSPVQISSGIRCIRHNANVGGVANSRHLLGKAMDFRVTGKTAGQVLEYVMGLPGVRYAYAIDETYVHMDVA